MSEADKQLCSRNFLDGLFLGVPALQRDEAAALCRKYGYDPAHPHAFYPAAVAVKIAAGLGSLLLPAGTVAQQQHSLGKMMVEGYGQTIPGMQAVAAARGVKLLKERLSHYMRLLTHEFPSAWQEPSVTQDDT